MHNSDNSPLLPLCKLDHPVAELVESFLSQKDEWKVDNYFKLRTQAFYQDSTLVEREPLSLDEIDFRPHNDLTAEVRLVSFQANFFRGFRKQERAIDLRGDLVVIDGRNSTGKTSLAEALEWLLTGKLIRREQLDAKELADCISNRFRPDGEETWVEGTFKCDSDTLVYRRVLKKDYGTSKTSECESVLHLNSEAIDDSNQLINELFAGVAPLLMQHTLQQFVVDPPSKRRDYFEKLLNVDDISTAIEKAVVGDIGLERFPRPGGTNLIDKWRKLLEVVDGKPDVIFAHVAVSQRDQIRGLLSSKLLRIATDEFEIVQTTDLEAAITEIDLVQRQVRQSRFSLLERLRPQRTLDESLSAQLSISTNEGRNQSLLDSWSSLTAVESSIETISAGQEAIASALESLRLAGLIEDVDEQICPLCNYQEMPTLAATRISQVYEWNAVRQALARAKSDFNTRKGEMVRHISHLKSIRTGLIPTEVGESDWEAVDAAQYKEQFENLRKTYTSANADVAQFDHWCSKLLKDLKSEKTIPEVAEDLDELRKHLTHVEAQAKQYAGEFKGFEEYLNGLASIDQLYAARELWLIAVNDREGLLADILWERAKESAKSELEKIRSTLREYRQSYLIERRHDFNSEISKIWSKLREDRYSSFGQIVIPEPRGKGYPVRLEVKAILDNNAERLEVDALGLLSESQINAIGIAAFITRSKLIGHKCLIMDDPVQSMDSDHFKTFANDLLAYLSDLGFQVVVLTHNDRFARDISHIHYDRSEYVTMGIAHSRRKGINISEGNRRVAERLKLAETYTDDGQI